MKFPRKSVEMKFCTRYNKDVTSIVPLRTIDVVLSSYF